MRIAKVSSTFLPGVGGVEWKVHYLATELARLGHDVTIFTSHPNPRKAEVMRLPEQPYNVIRCCSSSKGFGRFGVTEWLGNRNACWAGRKMYDWSARGRHDLWQ
jgi:hypothetical protein